MEYKPRNHKKGEGYLKQSAFLTAYAATASLTEAARIAGIHRTSHYDWFRRNPSYRERFEAVQDEAAQALEDIAVKRATGTERPLLYKGKPVKHAGRILYEYTGSDYLLGLLLKRFRPALYRENVTTEHTGSVEITERLNAARQRLIEMKHDSSATA